MNTSTTETLHSYNFVLNRTKFWIVLALVIMSTAVTLSIFLYIIKHPTDRKAPHNLALFVLIVVNFIEVAVNLPISLHFYYIGSVVPATPAFCTFWTSFTSIIDATINYLIATISIQRHMFIFNSHVLQTRWIRYLLHYLPIILCIVYPILFYFFAVIIYPCDGTQWDYYSDVCGFANCYFLYDLALAAFDLIVNNIVPLIVDVVANIVLIIRVTKRKQHFRQANTWKRHRRLTLQLFYVSCLYLVSWGPPILVATIEAVFDPTFLYDIQRDYLYNLAAMEFFLLPGVWIFFFPDFTKWIRSLYCHRRKRNVVGTTQQQKKAGPIQQRSTLEVKKSAQGKTKSRMTNLKSNTYIHLNTATK